MRLKSVRVTGYKSFADATIELRPGFNVITGRNNSGKTALLEAISLSFQDKRRLSLDVLPTRTSAQPNPPRVEVVARMEASELKSLMPKLTELQVPEPATRPTSWIALLDEFVNRGTDIRASCGPGTTTHSAETVPHYGIGSGYANYVRDSNEWKIRDVAATQTGHNLVL
jgi:hypothetical protein